MEQRRKRKRPERSEKSVKPERPKNLLELLAIGVLSIFGIDQYHGEVFLTTVGDKKKRKLMSEYEPTNRKIILIILAISAFGMIIQYSASCYMCANSSSFNYDALYNVKRQLIFLILSFIGMWFIQHINYQILFSRLAVWLYLVGIGSVFLLMTSLAISTNGAKRWISLGFFQFAPAELVKIVVFVMLSYMAQRYRNSISKMGLTVRMWIIGGFPAILVYIVANDLSSACVILLITFGITLISNSTWKLHLGIFLFIVVVVALYIFYITRTLPSVETAKDIAFRKQRIIGWLYPETYYSNIGYQISNTLYICGAGGLTGKGLGAFQMLGNLVPYAYTDVIFGVVVYELGFVGATVLILMYVVLLAQIYRVIINAEDLFGSMMALGVFLHISVQVLFHVGVVLNVLPNTGQTLPWISYGGSNILCLGVEIGLLLSIVRLHQMRFAQAEIEEGYV